VRAGAGETPETRAPAAPGGNSEQSCCLRQAQGFAGTAGLSPRRIHQCGHVAAGEVVGFGVPDRPLQPEPRDADGIGRVGPSKPCQRRADVCRGQVGQDLAPELSKYGREHVPVLRHGLRRAVGHPFAEPVLDGQAERVVTH
jgi:hypothetical protein